MRILWISPGLLVVACAAQLTVVPPGPPAQTIIIHNFPTPPPHEGAKKRERREELDQDLFEGRHSLHDAKKRLDKLHWNKVQPDVIPQNSVP